MTKLTSNWVRDRWNKAKQKQSFYNENFQDKKSVKEFYKNANPLKDKIHKFVITFELKYYGQGYEFFIPQESFIVYSLNPIETENYFKENTKQAISKIFRGKSIDWIYNNLDVTTRGIEKSNINYDEVDINKLRLSNTYNSQLPQINVNKKNKNSSVNNNKYNLDIWL